MFDYKHTEIIEYVKMCLFLMKIQISPLNNSRTLRIKNAKFAEYCFI